MRETDLITRVQGVTRQLQLVPPAGSRQNHLFIVVKTGASDLGLKITEGATRESATEINKFLQDRSRQRD
jgi:hypothetical protein